MPKEETNQLHANIFKILQEKKNLRISQAKTRKLRDALNKLHEKTVGCGQESVGYFKVPLEQQQQENSSLTNTPVPHFLESVTKYILTHHATQEGLLRKNGNERRANSLKDFMEKNKAAIPTGEYSVHDVTCVLKRWFRCLPEPVIPNVLHDLFAKCVELLSHHHRTQALLMTCLLLPAFHLHTLKHVAVFLKEIAKNDGCNKMTSTNLAKVLAPSLMPRIAKIENDPELAKKFSDLSTTAVQVLIDNADMIGVLAQEFETKDCGSADDLSDHELNDKPHSKKKILGSIFKKIPPSKLDRNVPRTPQTTSKRGAPHQSVPQTCPPKITKAVIKRDTPPPQIVLTTDRTFPKTLKDFTSPPLQNEEDGRTSPKSKTCRVARKLSVDNLNVCNDVREVEMENKTEYPPERGRTLRRNNCSIRSLPADCSRSMMTRQRRVNSVRRSATLTAAKRDYVPDNKTISSLKATSSLKGISNTRGSISKNSPRKPPRLRRTDVARKNSRKVLKDLTQQSESVQTERIPIIQITAATPEKTRGETPKGPNHSDEVTDIGSLAMVPGRIVDVTSTKEVENHIVYRRPGDVVDKSVGRTRRTTRLSVILSSTTITKMADDSGTCVDSDDEVVHQRNTQENKTIPTTAGEEEDFVDGEAFMKNLQNEQTRSMANWQTPTRTEAVGSPNSRRESVIAIRTSRAGFVRNNVRNIETAFATPTGFGVRTRRQTPGPASATPLRLDLNENSSTPISQKTPMTRSSINRRPLTPANTKKTLPPALVPIISELIDL